MLILKNDFSQGNRILHSSDPTSTQHLLFSNSSLSIISPPYKRQSGFAINGTLYNKDVRDYLKEFHSLSFELDLRLAEKSDADVIAQIASSVNVYHYSKWGRGFLIYTLTAEDYRKRIIDGNSLYLFLLNGQPIGYVCGYNQDMLKEYLSTSILSHESSIGHNVQTLAHNRGNKRYLYLDQIAILPVFQELGLGEQFFCRFCEICRGPYYVAMLEAPLRHPRISYWEARGFQRIGNAIELLAEQFIPRHQQHNHNHLRKLLWGIYILLDKTFTTRRTPVIIPPNYMD